MQSSSQIITTNKPTSSFLQAGCPSCRPTNSVRALKGRKIINNLSNVVDCRRFSNRYVTMPGIWRGTGRPPPHLRRYGRRASPVVGSVVIVEVVKQHPVPRQFGKRIWRRSAGVKRHGMTPGHGNSYTNSAPKRRSPSLSP